MFRHLSWPARSAIAAFGVAAIVVACNDDITNVISPLNNFHQTNLVADVSGSSAATIDPDLVNSWGITFGPTGVLWVANNHTGTSTLYNASGTKMSLTVVIPGAGLLSAGVPTGLVLNSTTDFDIPGSGPALFIFAGEDGTIAAWNTSSGSSAHLVANRSSEDAVYKGIAIASNGGANFLYLTNFKNNSVDVFDGDFGFVKSFTDPTVPAGFAPFGIANIGGQLFVTFAKQLGPDNEDDDPGVGNGFVDVFNADGTMARRFASHGRLNSPWAVAVAPASFGAFGGDILVGNFGNGVIGAYDPTTGAFIDELRDANKNPIAIDGLWGLKFGPSAESTTLYFAAGPEEESHGVVGTLTPQ
jgi:uncharacterized protein (TIGR03118 family)